VLSGSEEFAEMGSGLGNRVRGGDADDVEAFALAVGDEEGLGLARVGDQKSRSA
jgi:hypothetical protein